MTSRRPKVRELSSAECWSLVAAGGVGRIGNSTDDGPIILPVNFIVDDETVVFRTTAYGLIGRIDPASEIAFEVDRLDEARHEGWSVLLVGAMERVEDPDEAAAALGSADLEPWVG